VLEISSPGLDRKLFKPEHFSQFTGSLVKFSTRDLVNGNRHFEGRLVSLAKAGSRSILTRRSAQEGQGSGSRGDCRALLECREGQPGARVIDWPGSVERGIGRRLAASNRLVPARARRQAENSAGARPAQVKVARNMASELYDVIDALSREKGIIPTSWSPPSRTPSSSPRASFTRRRRALRAVLDRETGAIRAYSVREILPARMTLRTADSDLAGRGAEDQRRRRGWR